MGGNVRELENVIRRMVVLTDGEQEFEERVARGRNGRAATPGPAPMLSESLKEIARRSAREAERKALTGVLERVAVEPRRGVAHSQGQLQDAALEDRRMRIVTAVVVTVLAQTREATHGDLQTYGWTW